MARAAVLRLIRRKPASWRTVGSCMPGLSDPVSIRWRIWVWSCTWTGTALLRLTRSSEGGAMCEDSRATCGSLLGSSSSRLAGPSGRPASHPVADLDQGEADGHGDRTPRRPEIAEESLPGCLRPGLVQPLPDHLLFHLRVHHRSSSSTCP